MKAFPAWSGVLAALVLSAHAYPHQPSLLSDKAAQTPAEASKQAPPVTTQDTAVELPTTVVVGVATKQLRPLIDVAAAVDVIDAADLQNTLSESLTDALRYESGVSVEGAGSRFGDAGINVRGVSGNRVTIEVDGVPANQQFALGSYAHATATLPQVDLIKKVEILKGPASTLYGSDALGGVVAIRTWDPLDLVSDSARRFTVARGAYDGRTHGRTASMMTAWRGGEADGLLAFSQQDGKARIVHDSVRLERDFADWEQRSVFGKMTHDNGDGDLWRLTFLTSQKDSQSQINSFIGQGRFLRTTELRGDDRNTLWWVSLEHEFLPKRLFDDGLARVYYTRTGFVQNTYEKRLSRRGTPLFQHRVFDYAQAQMGLELNAGKNWHGESLAHSLIVGVELERTELKEKRDASQTNLLTGDVTNSILGETFPRRDFPNSTVTEAGLFVLNEIIVGDSPWTVIPAIRLDHYRLRPQRDALFDANGLDTAVVSITETNISPKLGVLYALSDVTRLYAQYARGFRAPPFDDANIGLNIPLFNLRAIPNPDLKSETSNGFEIGLRHIDPRQQLEFSLYYTRFSDFIESKARLGVDPESGTLLFQSINIHTARIYGSELDYRLRLDEQWAVKTKLAWSRGDNLTQNAPLNSIAPNRVIISAHWQSTDIKWTGDLYLTASAAKKRVDESREALFQPPGFGVTDAFVSRRWETSGGWQGEVRLGIYNVFNKKYWDWFAVRNFDASDSIVNALTRPGRTYSLSVSLRFL